MDPPFLNSQLEHLNRKHWRQFVKNRFQALILLQVCKIIFLQVTFFAYETREKVN